MKREKTFDIVLFIILLSYFMILLDNSIVFTSSVEIGQSLHISQQNLSWISNAYSLTFGGFILAGGRSGDIFGRKKVFNLGLIIFGLGSLFVGLSVSPLMIFIARGFQGIGSAILAPTTLALIMDNYTGTKRTRAVALYGATAGIGASVGLVLGGFVSSDFSWRWGFLLNVPISLLMLLLSIKFISNQKEISKESVDWLGTFVSTLSLLLIIFSVNEKKLTMFILGIIGLVMFILREKKITNPIMPLTLYKNRERLGGYLARFFYLGSMMGFWFFTPQLLQHYLNFSPLEVGFSYLPFTIMNFISAMLVAKLIKKMGNTKVLLMGIVTTWIGFIGLTLFNHGDKYLINIAIPMLIAGWGQGLSLSPLTNAGIADVNDEESGAASGVVNVMHQIGGAVGLAIVTALTSEVTNVIEAYRYQSAIFTSLVFISLLIALILVPRKRND